VASTYINKLEDSLGVRLCNRTTRKVSLTEEGIAFLPHAEDVLASIEAAKGAVGVGNASPSGTLRVAAPASFGRMHMIPAIHSFLDQHPNLSLDLRLSDTMIDMVEGGFDIAIRNAELKDSTLIARKLAPDTRIVCASPEYIKRYGEPKSPEELHQHQCISLMGLSPWTFSASTGQITIKASGIFRADNGEATRDACAEGLGITISSKWCCYQLLEQGKLVQILADYPLVSNTAIWAVYPSSRLVAPKVRAFIEHLNNYFGESPYWDAH
jgi:DNA-binding transcriptional LysR family regulator